MNRAKDILAGAGLVGVGVVGILLLVALLFAISTAFTALIVALAWNWIGLHELFNQEALTFWQVVGVAIIANVVRSIFSGGSTIEAKSS